MKLIIPISTVMLIALLSQIALAKLTPDEQAEIVSAHNQWRRVVNVPDLHWSAKLADMAQRHADTLKNAKACQPMHSQASDFGENMFWASPIQYSDGFTEIQQLTPTQVVDDWGSEKNDYNYPSNSCAVGKRCGHYTQIIWNSTTEVGCGKAFCPDNSQVWVCNYEPAGNYVGQKPY